MSTENTFYSMPTDAMAPRPAVEGLATITGLGTTNWWSRIGILSIHLFNLVIVTAFTALICLSNQDLETRQIGFVLGTWIFFGVLRTIFAIYIRSRNQLTTRKSRAFWICVNSLSFMAIMATALYTTFLWSITHIEPDFLRPWFYLRRHDGFDTLMALYCFGEIVCGVCIFVVAGLLIYVRWQRDMTPDENKSCGYKAPAL
jgi:hypothetical protein